VRRSNRLCQVFVRLWNQDKITTAGGAVAGALLGGLIGGKKGAAIGAVTGGAGAAVYTYKIRNRYPLDIRYKFCS